MGPGRRGRRLARRWLSAGLAVCWPRARKGDLLPRTPTRSLLVTAALLACAACRPAPERVVLGFAPQPATGLVLVAIDRGFLAAEGIALEIRTFPAGRDALRALLAGEVDLATVYETPIVLSAFGGPSPVRLLTTLHRASGNTAVVARADRRIRAPADLRGRRVGVPRSTNAEYFLQTLLVHAGVVAEEVATVDLAPSDAVEALRSGTVDAVAIWSPYLERAQRAVGRSGAVVLSSDVYDEVSLLVTRADLLRARPRALVKVMRALERAERLVTADPRAALPALRRAFPAEDPADIAASWSRITPRLGLDNLLLALLTEEAEWFSDNGRVQGAVPDFAPLLAPGPLLEVLPEAVTVEAVATVEEHR
jgi:ABC-type nitrate/sulfonate/bicarbonate transport system substrate-binding protein